MSVVKCNEYEVTGERSVVIVDMSGDGVVAEVDWQIGEGGAKGSFVDNTRCDYFYFHLL